MVWPLVDLARGPPAWKNSGIQCDSSHIYIVLYFYNFCFLGTFHDAHHFVLYRPSNIVTTPVCAVYTHE